MIRSFILGPFYWGKSFLFFLMSLPLFFKHPKLLFKDVQLLLTYFFNYSRAQHSREIVRVLGAKISGNKKLKALMRDSDAYSKDFEYEMQDFKPDHNICTYAETPFPVLKQIFKQIKKRHLKLENNLFLDVGCGRGRTLIYASCVEGMRSQGIDILPSFQRVSGKVGLNIKTRSIDQLGSEQNFWTDLNIIYICGTCFSQDLRNKIKDWLVSIKHRSFKHRAFKHGTVIVVSVTHPIEIKGFQCQDMMMCNFPWGKDKVFIYESNNLV